MLPELLVSPCVPGLKFVDDFISARCDSTARKRSNALSKMATRLDKGKTAACQHIWSSLTNPIEFLVLPKLDLLTGEESPSRALLLISSTCSLRFAQRWSMPLDVLAGELG